MELRIYGGLRGPGNYGDRLPISFERSVRGTSQQRGPELRGSQYQKYQRQLISHPRITRAQAERPPHGGRSESPWVSKSGGCDSSSGPPLPAPCDQTTACEDGGKERKRGWNGDDARALIDNKVVHQKRWIADSAAWSNNKLVNLSSTKRKQGPCPSSQRRRPDCDHRAVENAFYRYACSSEGSHFVPHFETAE